MRGRVRIWLAATLLPPSVEQVVEVMAMPSLVRRPMVAGPAQAEAVTARAAAQEVAVRQVRVQVELAKQAAGNLVDRPADNRLPAPVVVAKAVVP